jgi:hypothetical protein
MTIGSRIAANKKSPARGRAAGGFLKDVRFYTKSVSESTCQKLYFQEPNPLLRTVL